MISAWLVALRATAHAEVTQVRPVSCTVPKRPDSRAWRYWPDGARRRRRRRGRGGRVAHRPRPSGKVADDVDCAQVKCVALTFDDGPGPYTDRLLQILKDNDAKATFFLIGNKVAANPAGAKRIVDAGMEVGNHTWEHPNMTTIPPEDIPAQFTKASDAIEAATGQRPKLVRTAGGLINDAGAGGGQAAGPGRHQLGRHPLRLDQRLQHRGDALHADDADQAGLGGAVPRHLLQHRRSGVPVHPGAEGQRLPPGDGQPDCSGRASPAAATAAATTARPSTTFTTSRPKRSRRCRTRRRPRRCRTSRSPTFPAPTPADPTTAPDASWTPTPSFVLTVLVLCYALVSGLVKKLVHGACADLRAVRNRVGAVRAQAHRRCGTDTASFTVVAQLALTVILFTQAAELDLGRGGAPPRRHVPPAGDRNSAGARPRHVDRAPGAARHAAVGGGVSGRDRRADRGRADRCTARRQAHPRTHPSCAVHRKRLLRRLRAGCHVGGARVGFGPHRTRSGTVGAVPGPHRGGVRGGRRRHRRARWTGSSRGHDAAGG